MDFSEMERAVYGGNVEEDEELLAELLALQREEETKQMRSAPVRPSKPTMSTSTRISKSSALGVDPALLEAALADDIRIDEQNLENDEDLLAELSSLVGDREGGCSSESVEHKNEPDSAMMSRLSGLLAVYEKMLSNSSKEGNISKVRRHQRSVDRLKGLISKAERGEAIDESEIPPAPPSLSSTSVGEHAETTSSITPPPIPKRSASALSPLSSMQPPPVPERSSSSSPHMATSKEGDDSKKQRILEVLKRRRDAYVANGKAAVAAMDKVSAKQYVETAKMFDQALAAIDTANADELDMSEVPPSPEPYRRVERPTTFIGGLESRMDRFQNLARKAAQDGNDRKARMNTRMAEQYKAAILDAKAGRPVAVADLPSLPDMPPLPPQKQETTLKGPTPGVRPPPAVGPLAASGQPGSSRNSTQLQFLIMRQNEFKQAAIHAKSKGNMEMAKKYLLEAKGFDKMIAAAKSGLPISIKSTPIPPQASTSHATLQPRIVAATSSTTGIEGRGETLSMLEKSLIEQVQLAENSRMRFTRLGDVGKVKLFEDWAKTSKQDLLLVREVAKEGLNLPKFHYESRYIPCADLFPELAEDVLELSIIRCRDVPLPSGYEPSDANIFVKFVFPYPADSNQTGKTKYVPGTQNPEFDDIAMLQIGTRRARSHKLMRVLKRNPLKLEVYQKGSFLRSDKLLGTCEWKLEQLESNALMEETLPLKEGRKAVGGLMTLKIRIREPLGDAKLTASQHRWLVLDN